MINSIRFIPLILIQMAFIPVATSQATADISEVSSSSAAVAEPAFFPWPISATLSDPTDRYPHNVLGNIPSLTTLTVTARICENCAEPMTTARLTLPAPLVFEDVAPQLWDVTGDGRPEIVVVQSHENAGARLTVWSLRDAGDDTAPLFGMIAATDFIGTRFRWLAPFGAGDFTGDGRIEIAYVETPHLGKVMRLVAIEDGKLVERAAIAGVTNHRIGQDTISGGVRTCNGRTEAVLATADWQRIVAVQWQDGALNSRDLGPLSDLGELSRALTCP